MIDTHAHLYFDRFDDDRGEVIARARKEGISTIINVGIDAHTSRSAIELAEQYPGLRASAGIHPTSKIEDLDEELTIVRALVEAHRGHVVALGEFGLDFYWKDVSHDEQYRRLEAQLDLALELELPVIYHCRDALSELFAVLAAREEQPDGVFHCFGGGPDEVRRALDLGYHVSFAGNVTFPKATDLQNAARSVPADRLLLETDSPFLAPQARRGKRNEPAFVRHACEFLAELRGVEAEELERQTDENASRLFGL